jgi:hypothetical protein
MSEVRKELDDITASQSTTGKNRSEFDWRDFAPSEYDEELVADAIKRLENCDVTVTPHGIRVELRPDLGDYRRSGAAAFWPRNVESGTPYCSCNAMREFGRCGHLVAARMYLHYLSGRGGVRLVSNYFRNKRRSNVDPTKRRWWRSTSASLATEGSSHGEKRDVIGASTESASMEVTRVSVTGPLTERAEEPATEMRNPS